MNPVVVICIAMPIVAAFFWLSGYCFGRAAQLRELRRSGYQPAPGKLGTPPKTGSVVYRQH